MKKHNIIISAALVSGMLFEACVNDLDVEPLTPSVVTSATAWNNDTAAECFLAKIYSAFAINGQDGPGNSDANDIVGADQGEATFIRSYWNLQELSSDEAKCSWGDEALNGLNYSNWGPTNRFIMLNYDRLYVNIAFCNEFLHSTSDDGGKMSEYRAEARVLRAFSYYVLMDLYGNIPFTDENSGIGAYLPEQQGRAYFFQWIESELKDVIASGALPEKSTANYGKVNKYVAEMVLANLYINAEVYGQGDHYADAATHLADIIDNGGYILEPNYQHNFNADNNLSSEIIFPIIFDGLYAQSFGGTTFVIKSALGKDMQISTYGVDDGWEGNRAPQDLSSIFESGDTRALFYKEDRTQDMSDNTSYKSGWTVVKFNNLTRDGQSGSNPAFADTDFPFYRLADAYLLYVETALKGAGDAGKAVGLYNQIQERAFGDKSHNIGSLSEIDADKLLDERARELYWEGHRRTDLIRFGKFLTKSWAWKGGNVSGVNSIDSKYLLFPLPSTDVSANSNLKQNDGY